MLRKDKYLSIGKHRVAILLPLLLGLNVASSAKDYSRISIIGDSITAGFNPEKSNMGWVQMLSGTSNENSVSNTVFSLWPDVEVINHAVSGSSAAEWFSDQSGMLSDVKQDNADLIIIFIGGNDLQVALEGNLYPTDIIDQAHSNLTGIVTNLLDAAPQPDIILLSYYDLFDGLSENLTGERAFQRPASEGVMLLNEAIQEVASSNHCFHIHEIYSAFLHHGYGAELNGADDHLVPDYFATPLDNFDTHPITIGHQRIYELVYEKLVLLKNHYIPLEWMKSYGLTNFNTDVIADPDHDGLMTWEEYIIGSNPVIPNTDPPFTITAIADGYQFRMEWVEQPERVYDLLWTTNLSTGFMLLQSNVIGGLFEYTISNNAFFKLNIRLP